VFNKIIKNDNEVIVPFLSLKDVNKQHKKELYNAVCQVIDSGMYLQSKENLNFEILYAKYIGSQYAIGCANGLDALILIICAYMELGILKKGDEVIVPANTYIASILAITKNGLKAVLVEPNYDTCQIDDSRIENAITSKTKAIMIVHLYGRCAYTEKIREICKKHNLHLIEDNAQACGCMYVNESVSKRTGSLGGAAGHSFYPGKNLGAFGDGGMVTTSDSTLAETVRILANYGSSEKYIFKYQGINSRLDEIQAAILAVKLKYLDSENDLRRKWAKKYLENIKNPKIIFPKISDSVSNVYHIFPIFTENRDTLQEYLFNKGIQTIIHYPIAPHKQDCYNDWNSLSFPITEKLCKEELSLPLWPTISEESIDYVIKALNLW
jgi:dTDP-4-amino-4,6-dideoxygalactose transaminase